MKERRFLSKCKSAATFLLFVAMVAVVLYFKLGTPPFAAVAGRSMEPMLKMGDFILISPLPPSEITEGDVIVVRVPDLVRERYSFPHTLVHRVTRVETYVDTIAFRMQGDNNPGEDPFTIAPGDIQGTVNYIVPHLGYLILFFQSQQGFAFAVAALIIYLLYVLSEVVEKRARGLVKAASSALNSESTAKMDELGRKQEDSLGAVSQSLVSFASAMSEYAIHLGSHTDAVKSLAESAADLRSAVRKPYGMPAQTYGASYGVSATGQHAESILARYPSRDADVLAPIYAELLLTRRAVETVEATMSTHVRELNRQTMMLKNEIHDLNGAINGLASLLKESAQEARVPITQSNSSSDTPSGPAPQQEDPSSPAVVAPSANESPHEEPTGFLESGDSADHGDYYQLPLRSQRKRSLRKRQ